MAKKPYYLTTAIAYTSGKPHIGNTYEVVQSCDIKEIKVMMCGSRPERTNMARK